MSFERYSYYRLETDEEFRARLGRKVLAVPKTVERFGWYGVPHKDTIAEPHLVRDLAGEALDEAAWLALKMQRRLIFVP